MRQRFQTNAAALQFRQQHQRSHIRSQFERGRFMDWPSDPWTKGSYSVPAPGEVTTIGPLLHKGCGRLHFAGEHTCYAFVGYMEGALNSGIAVAKRLAVRDGILKSAA